MKMKEKIITDLALASYLSATGHRILSTHTINGRKLAFHFEPSEEIEKDILSYFNREAKVCPLTFFETVRNLKGMISQD